MIVSNVVYMRAWGLFDALLPAKLGIEVDFVDITDLDAVRAVVRPNTRLIHTAAIANPDLRVAEIAALAEIAHADGALLTVDSTFTTPPMLRRLDLGADLVAHSYVPGIGNAAGDDHACQVGLGRIGVSLLEILWADDESADRHLAAVEGMVGIQQRPVD